MANITRGRYKYQRIEYKAKKWKPLPKVERCGWKLDGQTMWVNKFKLNNLLDDKEEFFKRNNNFGTWLEYLGPRIAHVRVQDYKRMEKKRLCRMMVNAIANEFLELLMIDLIIKNNTYVLPFNKFGYLRVMTSKFPKDRKAIIPQYEIKPYLYLTKRAKGRYNLEKYDIVFTERWREIFEDEIKNGHKY
jgi:hypothetical protein